MVQVRRGAGRPKTVWNQRHVDFRLEVETTSCIAVSCINTASSMMGTAGKYDLREEVSPPELERWAPLEALPSLERPLEMATRLLETCVKTSRVGFLSLGEESEDLLRYRHLVHIWITLHVTTLMQVYLWEQSLKASDLDDQRFLTQANTLIRRWQPIVSEQL